MKTTRRSVLGLMGAAGAAPLAAGGLLAAAGPAHAAPAAADRVPESLRPGGELDRRVAELAAADAFSGSLLLTHRGRTVLARSYGEADRERGLANGPGTRFCLGSCTKLFTSVAIARLAEAGEVAYGGTLGRYLDGFPAAIADEVTVHQLLTHSSGMGDFHGTPEFRERHGSWHTHEEALDGIVDIVREQPLGFTPGSGNTYSNSGFAVLGAIVAAVSGRSYFDYIREHVFAAAGMDGSAFLLQEEWRADRTAARPYATGPDGERADALDRHGIVGSPAGGSFSTCADLDRFARALMAGELVGLPWVQLLLSPKLPLPARPESGAVFEAYGTLTALSGDQWVVTRGGGSPGVSAEFQLFAPARDWFVAVLSNYDNGARDVGSHARDLITGQERAS